MSSARAGGTSNVASARIPVTPILHIDGSIICTRSAIIRHAVICRASGLAAAKASKPAAGAHEGIHGEPGYHHQSECPKIAPFPLQLRHVLEVHAVDAGHEHR